MARFLLTYPRTPIFADNNEGKLLAILNGRDPVFAWNAPIDPDLSGSPVEVDSTTATASLAVNGRTTILTADTYGNLRLAGDDMEVIINSGVTIGTLQIEGSRIRIRAANGAARDHVINNVMNWPWDAGNPNRTDYLFDGLNIVSGEGAQGSHQNQFGMRRFAIINSYLDSVGFTAWLSEFGGILEDIFVGNSYLNADRIASDQSTTQATFRISGGWQRLVVASSRFLNDDGDGGGRQHFRLHSTSYASAHAWIDDVDFIGTNAQVRPSQDAGVTAPETMDGIVFNNTRWWPYNAAGQALPISGTGSGNDTRPTNVIISNSTVYTDGSNPFNSMGGNATLIDNQTLAYSAPPAWTWT
jgi:hypothetical protein